MEISSLVLRRTPAVSGFRPLGNSISSDNPSAPSTVAFVRTTGASARLRGFSAAFSDAGHLKYYAQPVKCGGGRTKQEKKRAKLLKGLSKDLAALRLAGVGADAAEGFAGDEKRSKITKAAELSMAELKRLRSQEREMKKKKKEDKKAAKKASKTKGWAAMDDSSSSSSSSSESSDDECGNKVLRMSNLRTTPALQELDPETLQIALTTPKTEEVADQHIALCKNAAAATKRSSSNVCCSSSGTTSEVGMPMNKIEVCVGGKCSKSGATELMEEFSKKIGHRGAVVGCKCMGKCRDGPNVRISAATVVPKNRLCVGVGVADVGTIVANLFGEKDAGAYPSLGIIT